MKLSELPVPSLFKFTHKDDIFIRYGGDDFKSTDKKNKYPYKVTQSNRDWEVAQLNTEYSLEIATVNTIPYGVVFMFPSCPNGDTWFKVSGGPHGDAIISSDDYTMHKFEKKNGYTAVFAVIQTFDIVGTKLIEFMGRQMTRKSV